MKIKICDACNMQYCPDIPSDVEAHNQTHDLATNGVPTTLDVIGKPLATGPFWTISLITQDDPLPQRSLLTDVALRASRSLPRSGTFRWRPYRHGSPPDSDELPHAYLLHAYLLHAQKPGQRVIGFAFVLRRPYYYPMRWDAKRSDGIVHSPTWCVEMLWTAHNYQRTGCAAVLLKAAFTHLGIEPDDASWSHPFSEAGATVVRRFCPVQFKAYDSGQ